MNFHKVLEELSEKSGKQIKSYVLINNVSPSLKKFEDIRGFIKNTTHFNQFTENYTNFVKHINSNIC